MKKKLFLAAFMLTAATSFAVREDLGPATTGSTANGSWVDVRVTANVVDGIAVNEASPIDFGNLVRDNIGSKNDDNVYLEGEKINAIKPGVVTYRAGNKSDGNSYNSFITYIDNPSINLESLGDGAAGDKADNKYIKNVSITGITAVNTTGDRIELNGDGTARKELRAYFLAYDGRDASEAGIQYSPQYDTGNLGSRQMLGNYEGTVRVYAIAKN